MKPTFLLALTFLITAACGGGEVEAPEKEHAVATTIKPQGPVQIDYKIIGTPIVGQPVAIDLYLKSTIGQGEISIDYRITDATAMQFPESQAEKVTMAAAPADEPSSRQQVRVIPLREGRLYLNVTAEVSTDTGTLSTAQAIPIQVGGAATRTIEESGELATDENGEQIRILEGD
ncbi:MAG: hypothetical protein GWN47_10680 [Woeseiaceae bacterium]|nr:hypothetical protein [Woeseiaceae bacterium]